MLTNTITLLLAALDEVEVLMAATYATADPMEADSPLSQVGLRDGGQTVREFIAHNENGLAFEHLMYMVNEPPLVVSVNCLTRIAAIGEALGFPPSLWSNVRTSI